MANNEKIRKIAEELANGDIGLGPVLRVDAAIVRQLAKLARGLQAARRTDDARVFLEGLLALYPHDPELLQLAAELETAPPSSGIPRAFHPPASPPPA